MGRGYWKNSVLLSVLVMTLPFLLLSGCKSGSNTAAKSAEQAKKNAKSKEKTKPKTAINAVAKDIGIRMFDDRGNQVLTLKASGAGANPASDENTVVVQQGTAVLYEKGKATATLTAENLTANREARTIVAIGKVMAKSLAQKGTPTVRADKMIWTHDQNLLTGAGNVVLTAEPAYTLFATSFKADTRLSRYTVKMGDTPSGGTY